LIAAAYMEKGDLEKSIEICDEAIKVADDNMIYDFVKRAKVNIL